MNDEKNWVHPYLEALREQNGWIESVIPGLLNKRLAPWEIVRAHEKLPVPEGCVPITGIEPTETEKAEIRAELERRTELIKELNSAIRKAMATRWKAKLRESKKAKLPPVLPRGILPEILDNEKGIELLWRAVDAGLLDESYQPMEGTTNAQLCVLSLAIALELSFADNYHNVFYQIWGKPTLRNTKWKNGEADINKLDIVAVLYPKSKDYIRSQY